MNALTQTLYDTDFNLWIEQTVNHLKNGNLKDLDLENLIEEIESMGRRDKREIISRSRILILHLLKWKYQPEKRTSSSIATINEQRYQIQLILQDSPSLKPYFRDNFADCYPMIRQDAAKETSLPLNSFPIDCPWSEEQILDADFFPE